MPILGQPVKTRPQSELELTGSKSRIIFEPLPEDDPKKRQPDISLAKKVLGWTPKMVLKDGLRKTIDYFDDLLSKQVR